LSRNTQDFIKIIQNKSKGEVSKMNKIKLRVVGRSGGGGGTLLVALKKSARVKGRSNEKESANSIQRKVVMEQRNTRKG